MEVAPSTTWALVRIQPPLSKTNPDPTPVPARRPVPTSLVIVTTVGTAFATAATTEPPLSWVLDPGVPDPAGVATGGVGAGAVVAVGAMVGATAATAEDGPLDAPGSTTAGVVNLNSAKLIADVRTALRTAASRATLTIRGSERPPSRGAGGGVAVQGSGLAGWNCGRHGPALGSCGGGANRTVSARDHASSVVCCVSCPGWSIDPPSETTA